tara:strand:- start:329 stop:502 length:174 start_codon:yes stop_codon:yes gene_type:complete
MQVKDLIKTLKKHNPNNRVVFYNLENHDLTEYNLESIIDCREVYQTEITTTKENVDE